MNEILNRDICDVLDDRMMEYSAYVILHRAIPSLEDGLKVSLRRILYTMHKENMIKLTKSANVSGQVTRIHPHGDTYPTIVNMVQKDNHANPFIDGKGAFAYHTSRDTDPASSRYTEVKIAPYSLDMMEGLKRNSVEMIPTFDGDNVEPMYLPVKHPNILTHAQEGMGVGMACRFPSFNLSEVCDATISYLQDEDVPMLIPDFPTGGYIINNDRQVNSININGSGSVVLQAKYIIGGDYILIKEIPYTTTREAIIEKIIELVKANKLKEIADIKDTTDLKGMEIEIKTRKNVDKDLLMQKLYKLTPLQSSFSANMNCLVDNKPIVLGVHDIIKQWTIHRRTCIKREVQHGINQYQVELNKLKGLEIIMSDLDKAISIIRSSKSEKEAILKLTERFKLSQAQVDYIITIKLINMNEDWLFKRTHRIDEIEKSIKKLNATLIDDKKIDKIIISQLEEVKVKYGQPRRTEILRETEIETIDEEDLIEDYNCNLVLSHEGYLKKTLRYSDTQYTKNGDHITQQIQSTNKSKVLLFTNQANVYFLNVYELESTQPSTLGDYLYAMLDTEQGEEILYMASTEDYKGYMLFGFENGKVSKIDLSAYETKTNRTKLVNAYNDKSKLIFIEYIDEDRDIVCITTEDKCVLFNTELVSSKASRGSQGNQAIKPREGHTMTRCLLLDKTHKELEYYRVKPNAIGKFIRNSDKIQLK